MPIYHQFKIFKSIESFDRFYPTISTPIECHAAGHTLELHSLCQQRLTRSKAASSIKRPSLTFFSCNWCETSGGNMKKTSTGVMLALLSASQNIYICLCPWCNKQWLHTSSSSSSYLYRRIAFWWSKWIQSLCVCGFCFPSFGEMRKKKSNSPVLYKQMWFISLLLS